MRQKVEDRKGAKRGENRKRKKSEPELKGVRAGSMNSSS